MELTFIYPAYLWLLISLPFFIALHFITLKFARRHAMKFANFEVIQRIGIGLKGGKILTRNIVLLIIRLLTLLFLIFSLAGTTVWYEGNTSDFDFVIAVDASGSMLAQDFEPNRLEAAKSSANLFLDSITSKTRVGVMSFSGTTFVLQRPTDVILEAKKSVNSIVIKPSSGTGIGDAIITGVNMFSGENVTAKVLVIMTDGQSNVGTLIEDAIIYAQENRVMVHTMGVATEEGGALEGIDAISRIDEESLKQIADNTGGKFFFTQTKEDMLTAYQEIVSYTVKKIPLQLSMPLVLITLLLIFLEWFLMNTRYRSIP